MNEKRRYVLQSKMRVATLQFILLVLPHTPSNQISDINKIQKQIALIAKVCAEAYCACPFYQKKQNKQTPQTPSVTMMPLASNYSGGNISFLSVMPPSSLLKIPRLKTQDTLKIIFISQGKILIKVLRLEEFSEHHSEVLLVLRFFL